MLQGFGSSDFFPVPDTISKLSVHKDYVDVILIVVPLFFYLFFSMSLGISISDIFKCRSNGTLVSVLIYILVDALGL